MMLRSPRAVAALSSVAARVLPLLSLLPAAAHADVPPGLEADMRCAVEGTAVVCHVTAKPSVQSHMTYARADVVKSPPFLDVLVATVDYSDGRDKQPKLNLAFRAKRAGTGDIVVKVQAMICADNGSSCPAIARAVVARVKIGP